MENISVTVMMCMIAIAAIQFTIILFIIKSGAKKINSDYADNKRSLINLLTGSPDNPVTGTEECC